VVAAAVGNDSVTTATVAGFAVPVGRPPVVAATQSSTAVTGSVTTTPPAPVVQVPVAIDPVGVEWTGVEPVVVTGQALPVWTPTGTGSGVVDASEPVAGGVVLPPAPCAGVEDVLSRGAEGCRLEPAGDGSAGGVEFGWAVASWFDDAWGEGWGAWGEGWDACGEGWDGVEGAARVGWVTAATVDTAAVTSVGSAVWDAGTGETCRYRYRCQCECQWCAASYPPPPSAAAGALTPGDPSLA
jgi:hypothetical protein